MNEDQNEGVSALVPPFTDEDRRKIFEAESIKFDFAKQLESIKHENQKEIDTIRDKRSKETEKNRCTTEERLHTYRTVTDYAQIAVRSVIFVNGFGSTSVIAFIGNSMKNNSLTSSTIMLSLAAVIFAFGSMFGVLASVFAYFNQHSALQQFMETSESVPAGSLWQRKAGAACVLAGVFLFILATAIASWAHIHFSYN